MALLAGRGGGLERQRLPRELNVVAAEDLWGSIAEQLGGDRVEATNTSPTPPPIPTTTNR